MLASKLPHAMVACLALVVATGAQAQSKSAFVRDAIQGDLGEIELGQLAQDKAGSADVKAYGQMLATDHKTALDEMTTVARTLNESVPTKPKADAEKESQKLSKMTGAAFDREFVKHMVADHRKDIKEFEAQAKGSDEVAKTAQKQLPVLRKHLEQAQALEKKS
jgi:putative membrane protein